VASTGLVGSSFGSAIKARRLGLTQRALAERLKTIPSYISHIEHNRREPSLILLIRIAEILQLKPERLFLLLSTADQIIASRLRSAAREARAQAWDRFLANRALLDRHRVTARELKLLRRIRILGTVVGPNHSLFILKQIRKAQQEERWSNES
jgi:transcriptional regulator with XRE-family HTH domain